jgi:Ca-activated chloride channel family protein
MHFRLRRLPPTLLAGFALLIAFFHVILSGQDAEQSSSLPDMPLPERMSDQTYRVSVDLVNILCSVKDKNTNAFVTNLMQDDFTVYEDDEEQEIKNFARETDLPLTIAMLVDTSNSVGPKLKFEKEAATGFFHSILRENDRAMLVEFDSGVTLLQDFTNDPNKLAKKISELKAGGGTALYDAIHISCDEKLIRETGRKAIIILSDGEDESSRATLNEATEMALRAEATTYAISLSKGGFSGISESDKGDSVLKDIAKETGGNIFFPFKIEDLEDAFRQINQELRSQYSIGYVSTNSARDGSYRKIEIKVSERGLKLSHRKGYYSPKG